MLDGNAAIAQNAFFPVQECDAALAGSGVAVAGIQGDVAGLGPQLADVDRFLMFRPRDDGEFDGLAIGKV